MTNTAITRRELLRRSGDVGGALALPMLLRAGPSTEGNASATASPTGLRPGPDVYESIGVRPLINARGTYTIISGSVMLPEVRAAMAAAAQRYVHLDELTDAIGARLATLTGAEWGVVTSGCAAALTHATAACVAGGNPDLHVRIPDLRGFPRDEAIIPKHSRNVYDAAVRAVGLRVLEVETMADFEAALGPRTALVYLFAGPAADESPLSLSAIAPLAQARRVPILVDAAAEILTVPNVHLQHGATLVGYSGGKCLRGPQTAGLLLGSKPLVRAAWVHSAPHHGFARGMKVGKEEAVAMLMAVEMWVRRDHQAEWNRWTAWLDHIASRVATIDGTDDDHRSAGGALEPHAVPPGAVGPATPWRFGRPGRANAPGGRPSRRPFRRPRRRSGTDRASPSRRTCWRPARRRSLPTGSGRSSRVLPSDAAPAPVAPGRGPHRSMGRPHRVCSQHLHSHARAPATRATRSTARTGEIS